MSEEEDHLGDAPDPLDSTDRAKTTNTKLSWVDDFLRVTAVIPDPDGRESREEKVLSRKLCGHGSRNRGGDEKFQAGNVKSPPE